MALRKELEDEVAKVFRLKWGERDGNVVPEAEDPTLGNDAVKLDATVLYADLADSTDLVEINSPGCCRPLKGLFGVIGIALYPTNLPAAKVRNGTAFHVLLHLQPYSEAGSHPHAVTT